MALKSDEEQAQHQNESATEVPSFGSGRTGNMRSLHNRFTQGGALTPEIDKFMEDIKVQFAKDGTALTDKIAVHRLVEPLGAHAFISQGVAIVLIFTDLLPGELQNFAPASEYIRPAHEALKAAFPKVRMIAASLVSPEDYVRQNLMYQWISRSLAVAVDSDLDSETIQTLGANDEYMLEYDTNAARNFIAANYPKAVLPRIEVGFMVRLKTPRKPGAQQGLDADSIPLMAVGAFTEFVRVPDVSGGGIKFQPVVRITSVWPTVPLKGMAALGITLGTEVFIRNQQWRQQFANFGKNAPNIGNLLPPAPDAKSLWRAENPAQRDEFIAKYCLPAVLAVDVVEGVPRLPSLAQFGHESMRTKAMESISQFFGGSFRLNQHPFQVMNIDAIGTVGDDRNVPVDSRSVDYLYLVSKMGMQDEETTKLTQYLETPTARAQVIANKTGNFRSLYQCSISVLSFDLLSQLSQAAGSAMKFTSTHTAPGVASMDFAAHQGQWFQQNGFGSLATGSSFGRGWGGQPSFYQ